MVEDLGFLMAEDTQDIQEIEAPEGEPYLKFMLSNGTEVALPALAVAEVMSVSADRITPMPNTNTTLLGTLNLRGDIIWVADLGQFLGEGMPLNVDRVEVSVIAVKDDEDLVMGLAVDNIVGMEWLKSDRLIPARAEGLIRGEWHEGGKPLRLLDHIGVLRSHRWAG
ncbi:MAG: chemotaxis protein CheW [Synechococcales cyanobacterium]